MQRQRISSRSGCGRKAQKTGSALSASVLEPSLAHGSALLARLSSQCGSAAAARKRAMVGNGATRARGSRELKRRTFDKRTWQAFPESVRLAVLADQDVNVVKGPAAGPIRRLQSSDLAVLAVLADQDVNVVKGPAAGPIRRP